MSEPAEQPFEAIADHLRMLLQFFVTYHVEDGQPRGARDRVPAERVEVLHPGIEGAGDLGRGHDGAEGVAVPDGLAQRDDVRHDLLRLESPEVRADPPEPHLHLVGDADATGGTRVAIRLP